MLACWSSYTLVIISLLWTVANEKFARLAWKCFDRGVEIGSRGGGSKREERVCADEWRFSPCAIARATDCKVEAAGGRIVGPSRRGMAWRSARASSCEYRESGWIRGGMRRVESDVGAVGREERRVTRCDDSVERVQDRLRNGDVERNQKKSLVQNRVQNLEQNQTQNLVQNSKRNLVQNLVQNSKRNLVQNLVQNLEQNLIQNSAQNLIQNSKQNLKQNLVQSLEKAGEREGDWLWMRPSRALPVCVCDRPYRRCFGSVMPSEIDDVRSLVRVERFCEPSKGQWLEGEESGVELDDDESRDGRVDEIRIGPSLNLSVYALLCVHSALEWSSRLESSTRPFYVPKNARRGREFPEEERLGGERCTAIYDELDPLSVPPELLEARMTEQEKRDSKNLVLETDTQLVHAGDVYAIVRAMTRQPRDSDQVTYFLISHHLFIDTLTLLRALIALYLMPTGVNASFVDDNLSVALRDNTVHLLVRWIKYRYDAMRACDGVLELLERFLTRLRVSDPRAAATLERTLQHAAHRLTHRAPPPILPRAPRSRYHHLLDISPVALAQHLTMSYQALSSRVSIDDYSRLLSGEPISTCLAHMIDRFNHISFWAASEVVLSSDASSPRNSSKLRATLISHLISVMEHLLLLRNYEGVMQLFSALNNGGVSRLRKSWQRISPAHAHVYQRVSDFFAHNGKLYRRALQLHPPPCVPVQEILLRDLTFIDENPTVLYHQLVNFHKITLVGKAFALVRRLQKTPYRLPTDPHIEAFICYRAKLSSYELYALSKRVEPTKPVKGGAPHSLSKASPKALLSRLLHAKAKLFCALNV